MSNNGWLCCAYGLPNHQPFSVRLCQPSEPKLNCLHHYGRQFYYLHHFLGDSEITENIINCIHLITFKDKYG